MTATDAWASAAIYEPYVDRWSRKVASSFLAWLELPPGLRWLDAGCGTGAQSQTLLESAAPREVVGVDLSEGFVDTPAPGWKTPRGVPGRGRSGPTVAFGFV